MDWSLLSLLPLVVSIALFFVAFRAHERFWTLGFFGWQKVYAGLVFYLFSGLLGVAWFWISRTAPGASILSFMFAGMLTLGAGGVALVLAGSIERLRELSAERSRLEDIRAGFDLFDSLREIIAQPYAFLEVLDYALKEMVRAAGADSGGLWLYNPSKSEWVLTGWANLSEKLRQQTESVKGSGTGFDRLAATHKARLFTGTDKIRVFFPEWDAEGYQSILGLPLASGAIGSAGRQVLGAIVLADRSGTRFDDDRARRLYAASDYVAAVIAEGRIIRQLDSARNQLDAAYAELARERDEARRMKEAAAAELEAFRRQSEEETAGIRSRSAAEIEQVKSETAAQMNAMRFDLEKRLAAETEKVEQLRQRWEEARTAVAGLESRLASERAAWESRLEQVRHEAQTEREAARAREQQLVNQHQEATIITERRNAELEQKLTNERRTHSETANTLKSARETVAEREAEVREVQRLLNEERRNLAALDSELQSTRRQAEENLAAYEDARTTIAVREAELRQVKESGATERDRSAEELRVANERFARLQAELVAERETIASQTAMLAASADRITALESDLSDARDAHAATLTEMTTQLEDVERVAQVHGRSLEREIASLEFLVEDRDLQIVARYEAERDAIAEAARAREVLAAERRAAAEALGALEQEVQAERERRGSLLQEIDSLRASLAQMEERHQHELSEERIAHRRGVHQVEFRAAAARERLAQMLATPDSHERLTLALKALAGRLPGPACVYLWRRAENGRPEMVAWLDPQQHIQNGERLSPWFFESETIPAEGPTALLDGEAWHQMTVRHHDEHRQGWQQHWGAEHSPSWAAAWPWGASARESNGWVSAFGFSAVAPADSHIEEAAAWTELVAATLLGMTSGPVEPESPVDPVMETDVPEEAMIQSEAAIEEMFAETLMPSEFHPEPAVEDAVAGHDAMPEPSDIPDTAPVYSELHNVIIDWAAGQTEDALRLDLTAPPGLAVYPPVAGWLRSTLERGRSQCRIGEQNPAEFIVSTMRKNGHVVLRFLRSSEKAADQSAAISAVEDSDLCMNSSGADSPEVPPVSGRWLLHDGSRVGMELRFDVPPAESEPADHLPESEISDEDIAPCVLIIEPQIEMAELLAGMLDSLGYDSVHTMVGLSDFDVEPEFDLAVIDASHDSHDPWEPARQLREEHPDIPILLLIGAETNDLPDELPCDRLLRIPFQIEELQESIESLLAVEFWHHGDHSAS